ncbi:tRNA-uridine aminocarboxypropyltransferase [Vibrio sp. Isolate30]|jgi:DTW domain-containing protein YfiP|uniref:tRNA-uridine aminocarboxypropyltransferase n=1 Tax=Vibrio sp. Isolate30 TaxID=2908536 RepID=UPI001EFD8EDF|nr:tRNA-uridine aminocarboxypropyltransferase [Vibrio sp. Isolate30]MCG9632913.1 DTW domain-containing protein [Vibrio sp. Isolate30]
MKACICQWITPLESDVELIILQHPSEEHRPMGTARILSLSLSNSVTFIGEDFSEHEELNRLLGDSEYRHAILYPGETSVSVEQLSTSGLGNSAENKLRVILLDGTWKKAFKMWQVSSNLQQLDTVHLPKDLKGNYRIRKAPSENSLSTVEAGYHLLALLQPHREFEPLLAAFDRMIQFQIDQMPPGVFEKNYLS